MIDVRTAVYIRVSTVDQNCALQRQELEQYIQARNWTLVQTYEDAMSGAKSARPGLNRLLNDAAARKFDAVLCWKLDRFGRRLVDCLSHIQTLERHGVRFLAITQGLDTTRTIRPTDSCCTSWARPRSLSAA
jgi:DNA invertase Pin-like site-specific DNA recombinase